MATTRKRTKRNGRPLNRDRVLDAAVMLADTQGLEALSMRRLGSLLGVEAMSLYNHVSNKDDLLDGIVDKVTSEFDDPGSPTDGDWRGVIRRCARREHEVLLAHPWAAGLAESRLRAGPVRMRYYDALLGVLRDAGFSMMGAYRANLIIDSYVYGFTLQEVSWGAWPETPEGGSELAATFVDRAADVEFPNLVGIAKLSASGQIDIGADFEIGLDTVIDSLERIRETA